MASFEELFDDQNRNNQSSSFGGERPSGFLPVVYKIPVEQPLYRPPRPPQYAKTHPNRTPVRPPRRHSEHPVLKGLAWGAGLPLAAIASFVTVQHFAKPTAEAPHIAAPQVPLYSSPSGLAPSHAPRSIKPSPSDVPSAAQLPGFNGSSLPNIAIVPAPTKSAGPIVHNTLPASSHAPQPAPHSSAAPHRAVTPAPRSAVNRNVYIMGDSYIVRAEQSGLTQAISRAGGHLLKANGVVGRSLDNPGNPGAGDQTGFEALRADANLIRQAGVIIIGEGTNFGVDPPKLHEMMDILDEENPTAPVYLITIGDEGYAPPSNQQRSMNTYNQENGYLRTLAINRPRVHLINWCSDVFGGTVMTCHASFANLRPHILDPTDFVHPSEGYGINIYDHDLADAVHQALTA